MIGLLDFVIEKISFIDINEPSQKEKVEVEDLTAKTTRLSSVRNFLKIEKGYGRTIIVLSILSIVTIGTLGFSTVFVKFIIAPSIVTYLPPTLSVKIFEALARSEATLNPAKGGGAPKFPESLTQVEVEEAKLELDYKIKRGRLL